jgi:hypothetical protein
LRSNLTSLFPKREENHFSQAISRIASDVDTIRDFSYTTNKKRDVCIGGIDGGENGPFDNGSVIPGACSREK